jgi:Flp pilus assembly protein TadD
MNATELFHIALDAMNSQQVEVAMSTLKRCITMQDDFAQAHYLLGVNYAQIGMIDTALAAMRRALELAPEMELARFQLGLLLVSIGQVEEGASAWEPLADLDHEHPLYLFKEGIMHMVRDQFEDARRLLVAGIERNRENAALNHDMYNIVQRLDELLAQQMEPAAEEEHAAEEGGQHLGVSVYQGN